MPRETDSAFRLPVSATHPYAKAHDNNIGADCPALVTRVRDGRPGLDRIVWVADIPTVQAWVWPGSLELRDRRTPSTLP